MENRKILTAVKNILPLSLIVLSAVLSRILPHPPNFAPISGIALFSGSYLSGFNAFLLPLGIMFLSDMIIGFHSTILYVYGSFFLIVCLGKLLRKKNSFISLATTSFASSLIFFIITNFGVWLNGGLYTKNLQGLEQSYIMALPFFKNTIAGDFFYAFLLFYSFQFLTLLINKVVFVNKTS